MFSVSRRSVGIGAVLFCGCAALFVVGGSVKFGPSARSQAILPRVTNKSSSVRVSNVQRLSNGDVEVTLFNQSTKTIFAYTIVTGNAGGVRKGVTTYATVVPVAPGETKAEIIPAHNLDSAAARPPGDAGEIRLSAVYLEGGSGEGDPTDSGRLNQTMGGMKEQAKLAAQLLRNATVSREHDAERLLDTVESQIASTPKRDDSAISSRERDEGKAMVNDRLLKEIRNLRARTMNPGFDVKSQLVQLIFYYERLAEKL